MGRRTYEVGTAMGVQSPYPHLRQYVVSRTMTASPGAAVQLVSTDPADLVRELKRERGLDIWLCGGARLAGALYGEIDERVLKVNPVMLGAGMPLFEHASGVRSLELKGHETFAGGVAIYRYRVLDSR
jgi:dihydrofolate reductase